MARLKSAYLLLCLFVLNFISAVGVAQEMHHHHDPGEQLGKVSFPTSCAPAGLANRL